jgi:hypothetical protein
MAEELFHRYSFFNFTRDTWREAAERYVELEAALAELTQADEAVDHDRLHEAFGRCELCEQLNDLLRRRKEFAEQFAGLWARNLLELTKEK